MAARAEGERRLKNESLKFWVECPNLAMVWPSAERGGIWGEQQSEGKEDRQAKTGEHNTTVKMFRGQLTLQV